MSYFSSSDCTNMSRFLNRILGLEVELQNRLFAYFTETLSVVVQQAKKSGRWDEGILGKGRCYVSLIVVCTINCHFQLIVRVFRHFFVIFGIN